MYVCVCVCVCVDLGARDFLLAEELDLALLADTARLAERILSLTDKVDALLNNAGGVRAFKDMLKDIPAKEMLKLWSDKKAEVALSITRQIETKEVGKVGTYRGKRALRELYSKVMGMVDVVGLERKAACVGGDHVIVLVDLAFADPSLKRAEVSEVFRFRGDKVCEIRPFYFEPGVLLAAVAAKRAKG